VEYFNPHEFQVVNYLAHLLEQGLASGSVQVHKSAILTNLSFLNAKFQVLRESELIKRVLKGGFNERPTCPRVVVWDVKDVLSLIRSWGRNHDLSLTRLFQKTLTLLALSSACRVSELAALSRHIVVRPREWVFSLVKLKKNSSQKRASLQVEISMFEDQLLCPIESLKLYLERTHLLWPAASTIFITLTKPFRQSRPNTLAGHLKRVLQMAGIDCTAHSFRAASTSKALARGVSIEEILGRATWANASTFAKFYCRPIATHQAFSDAVLKL
jgi:integrase